MKTLVRVDTAREQRDRPFSRAREGEVACDMRKRNQTAIEFDHDSKQRKPSQKRELQNLPMNAIRRRRSCLYCIAMMSMKDELDPPKSKAVGRYTSLGR